MPASEPKSEAWRKMVLRAMPAPAWLQPEAPDGDVVLSSRVRIARNLVGIPFPHHADPEQLRWVAEEIEAAFADLGGFEPWRRLTEAERDYLLGSRLISPEFRHRDPGRLLLADGPKEIVAMVNEEDHLRLQVLTAGWTIQRADALALRTLRGLESRLRWQRAAGWGVLTASPSNVGEGRRRSALFHLIGLAHARRLQEVLHALADRRLHVRGLFGESSRAVGAFFQVSATGGAPAEFSGAAEYLIQEERLARRSVDPAQLAEMAEEARRFVVARTELSMADALRALGWVRWAAVAGLAGYPENPREVDSWIATLEVHGTQDPAVAARHRGEFLRVRLERRSRGPV